MSEQIITLELTSLEQAARDFMEKTSGQKRFAFYGSMGAGKTTFITALCNLLETEDLVSSPTFSIVNEYRTPSGIPVYHFDFYRIKDAEELYDIGFEDYHYNDGWSFIEWPEKAEQVIPDDYLKVYINELADGKREIRFSL